MSCGCDQGACGCCEAPSPAVPLSVFNVPGLPQIEYRIGTYGAFREGLIERLASQLALRDLTTRDDSDYAIALLDSWSYVADILTFYSERTINESFLRTARLRDSIVRLSAMVGYDPRPGLSATAPLAFTFDAGTRFTLVAGARVQSVPPAGDNAPPRKFETLSDLAGVGSLSRVPLVGPPVVSDPLAAGSTMAYLKPGAGLPDGVGEGTKLLAWGASPATPSPLPADALVAEQLLVQQIDSGAGPGGALTWAPAVGMARGTLSVITAELRLLGHDASGSFVATLIPAAAPPPAPLPAPTVVSFRSGPGQTVQLDGDPAPVSYDFALAAASSIDLDAEYPALVPGSTLVFAIGGPAPPVAASSTVKAVSTVPGRFGPVAQNVTRVTLATPLPAIPDRRSVQIFQLGLDVPCWDHAPATEISTGLVYAALADEDRPEPGREVMLTDDSGNATLGFVTGADAASDLPGYQAITVDPAPAGPLSAASAVMLGNVIRASHGETVTDELLGSGDATVPEQRFKLGKPPLTRVPHAGSPHGGQSTLVIRVDGLQWTEAERLYGAGPGDRIFVVSVDDDGTHWVTFGDGVTGARLATGAAVRATYRTGLGTAGNVGVGQLSSPLTRPKGLKAVTSPLAAAGGADPETAAEARENAPNTVRTFGRIVSLRDAEDQARSNALVAKASAVWARIGIDLGVSLTVAGPGGVPLLPSQLDDLRADLDARRDPNRAFAVHGHRPVALAVQVEVIAYEQDRSRDDVIAAVGAALLQRFAFETRTFGQPVRLSEVFVAAQGAVGVIGVDVNGCTLADTAEHAAHGLSADPVQERIDLAADELITLASGDLVVTAS